MGRFAKSRTLLAGAADLPVLGDGADLSVSRRVPADATTAADIDIDPDTVFINLFDVPCDPPADRSLCSEYVSFPLVLNLVRRTADILTILFTMCSVLRCGRQLALQFEARLLLIVPRAAQYCKSQLARGSRIRQSTTRRRWK